jgi:DNA (cytosine-5)-methyltransferase 1
MREISCIALAGSTIGRAPENGGNGTGYDDTGSAYTLTKTDVHAVCIPINTQIATRHKAMGEGTGMGIADDGAPAYTLQAAHSHAVAFEPGFLKREGSHYYEEHTGTIRKEPGDNLMAVAVAQTLQVRRLTPLECERLQGFPDNYTNVAGLSNSARYKALGNSMAVNCMRILGERIAMAETIDVISDLL